MANLTDGMLNYSIYQIMFLLVVCASSYVLLQYFIACVLLYVISKVIYLVRDHYIVPRVETKGRAVFITGCDTGLGNRIAEYLDDLGFVVFAGCLNTKSAGALTLVKTCSKRLHLVELNATKDDSVQRALETVKRLLPKKGLWGIVNNAGINMFGEVELSPVSLYEKCFDLNIYGYIRVMRSFLPLIRQSKGRVINVTSVRGLIVEPCQSNYSTSKHVMETLTDSLRLEMQKFGVKVSIIEPGNFADATAISSSSVIERHQSEIQEMFDSSREEVKQTYTMDYIQSTLPGPMGGWPPKADCTVVAKAAGHALCSGIPKERYLLQGKGSIVFIADEFVVLSYFYNIIPTWITDSYICWWKGLKKLEQQINNFN